MAEGYTSIKVVLDRLLRNNALEGISFESVIDYTVDFMEIVGVPAMYTDKLYEADIINYRTKLPCDFITDTQVLINDASRKLKDFLPARYATDTFQKHYSCTNQHSVPHNTDFTFSLNDSYIFTSIEKGRLKMSYKAIETDEEGYPLLPSNRAFINALEWFIKLKYYTVLWENGKLEDKRLQHTEQEYCWAVSQCETDMRRLSLSKAESFFNSFRTLIPRDNEFIKRFANDGRKELLRNHR